MEKREFWITALSESISKPGQFALILEEPTLRRRIPLVIGPAEAQSIAMALEQMKPLRPQTHDLFQATLEALGAKLQEVFIYKLEQDVFFAQLQFLQQGQVVVVESRPSDALALAARCNSPIFVAKEVFEASAYAIDERTRDKRGSYAEYTLEELQELLNRIIRKEDYESAARIRDAIEKRMGKGNSD
jgi:bifunctional DNase/RNase